MKTIALAFVLLFSAVLADPVALKFDPRDSNDSNLRCIYDLWLKIKDLDKSHEGVRDFAKDLYDTYQDLQENKRLCESLEKENPNWFERIIHENCLRGYRARQDFEYVRLTAEARRVFKGDFWVQLVLGLNGCFKF